MESSVGTKSVSDDDQLDLQHIDHQDIRDNQQQLISDNDNQSIDDIVNNFTTKVAHMLLIENTTNTITSPLSLFICLTTLHHHSTGRTRQQLEQALGLSNSADVQKFSEYLTCATKLWLDQSLCKETVDNSDSFPLGDLKKPTQTNVSIKDAERSSPILIINKEPSREAPKTDLVKPLQAVNKCEENATVLIVNKETFSHPDIEIVDFSQTSQVIDMINRWADTATGSLIPKVVDSMMINQDILFLISNAVVFSGKWEEIFKLDMTRTQQFYRSIDSVEDTNVSSRNVAMMTSLRHAPYYFDDKFHAVRLNYRDNNSYMMLMLPQKRFGLDDVKSEMLNKLGYLVTKDCFLKREIDLSVPKFSFESSHDMTDVLENVGLGGLKEKCHLERFCDVMLGSVIQRAVVELDETGTKVAAVTVMSLRGCCLRDRVTFNCEEPFIFCIVRDQTLLFVGQVTEPNEVDEGGTWVEKAEAEEWIKREERRVSRKKKTKSLCKIF